MNIFLVRHAQSESNVDHTVLHGKTNVSVSLTNLGIAQADEAGEFLSQHLKHANSLKVWNSSYDRTRLTANYIKNKLEINKIGFLKEESIYLVERQFGIVDDVISYKEKHTDAYNHYQLHVNEKKDFFARPLLGESAFDMCMRLDFFLKNILANSKEENHIIVSHGAAIKGLIMMHQKWEYEKYTAMVNPYNASINHIINDKFLGEIFVPSFATI